MSEKLYVVYNGPMVTTAAPAKVLTGASTKTMLQIRASATKPLHVVEWGISFDASNMGTPGVAELVDTAAIAATVTAYVAADIQPYNDPNAPASEIQIGSTTNSGYSASGEGTIVATRSLDTQLVDPALAYSKQFPLGREPEVKVGNYLRIRVTFGTTVNALCYVIFGEG
jgi:hypothetical protein